MIDTKRFLSLLLALLLLFSAACAAEEDTWICLTCGQDATGDTCAYCGETRDVWTCADCGTRNLSDTCSHCITCTKASFNTCYRCSIYVYR